MIKMVLPPYGKVKILKKEKIGIHIETEEGIRIFLDLRRIPASKKMRLGYSIK